MYTKFGKRPTLGRQGTFIAQGVFLVGLLLAVSKQNFGGSLLEKLEGEQYSTHQANPILEKKISLSLVNEPLKKALERTAQQVGLNLAYLEEDIRGYSNLTLNIKEESLRIALGKILKNTELEAIVHQQQLIIRKQASTASVRLQQNQFNLQGLVTDQRSKEVLPFASVKMKESGNTVLTDQDGTFSIPALKEGRYQIEVTYLGYHTLTKEVVIGAKAPIFIQLELQAKTSYLGGVTITGIRRGEVKALNAMRNAENIKYVLSKEQMEKFPDNTVSESMQRVPGVAVGYSYGVARDVIIRGLDPTRNSVQFNGNRAPATETQSRTVDLNGVLSNTVESIEVIKTLTPDRDADATGGIVNIITKKAESVKGGLSGKALLGYNQLTGKANYDVNLVYGQKKNRFGYLVGASYFKSYRGQDRIDISYDDVTVNGEEKRKATNVTYEAFNIERDNLGITLDFQYDLTKTTKLFLRSSYNKYYEFQYSGSIGNGFGRFLDEQSVDRVTIYREGRWRDYNRDIFNVNAGGKSRLAGFDVEYDLNFNRGFYDQPKYWNATFTLANQTADLDFTNPSEPKVLYTSEAAKNLSSFTTRNYINRHEQVNDIDGQGTLHARRNFQINQNSSAYLKFGGRGRIKRNDRFRNYFSHALKTGEPSFVLSDVVSAYDRPNFFGGIVDFSGFPETRAMENNFRLNRDKYVDNITYTRQNTDPDSYEGNEDLVAGYLMGGFQSKKWELTGGARYERTGYAYRGNQVLLDETGAYVGTNKIDTKGNFDGIYPSLNVRYKLSNKTNIRGAVTKSLSRPNYYDLVPWQEIERRRKRINQGNPGLVEETAVNYDLLFEHYFQSIGLLSGGFYYKDVRDVLFSYSFLQSGGEFDGYRINTVSNGAKGKIRGVEIAWQQQFTFLPGWWNGFGIYANYSYTNSKLEIPFMNTTRDIALPEMRPHVGNLSLTYEKYGFSSRISSYFFATYLREVGDEPRFDEYETGRMQLDFSASQQINKHWRAVLNISNLTGSRRSDYLGTKDNPLNTYVDKIWGSMGVAFRF